MRETKRNRIRVLVIDDSAYNRQAIIEMMESDTEIEVVGLAANGEEGLKEALSLRPDIITLDLEMPKMDGFTFLRILMSRLATPVIVISSYSRKQNVFKALELGALDFIAKPTRYLSPELHKIRDELVEKIKLVRLLKSPQAREVAADVAAEPRADAGALTEKLPGEDFPHMAMIVIGASTGGPPALQGLLQELSLQLPAAVLIAQHMPENFTAAFADRLNRYTGLDVCEAHDGERIEPGHVYISPGGQNMAVRRDGKILRIVLSAPGQGAKYTPSIDVLFESAAESMKSRTLGVLLTGMGSDGKIGMQAIKKAGGRTVAESEETAVIFGMPKEAIDCGCVDVVIRLDRVAKEIASFTETTCGKLVDD
ncbi:MAG TPA: chemotaxis response regulator protein-glutamate methylesterase [Myxococcota bacterium]|nr:chemotaxis response regulator protein-glutamate methylesterase [Myxococcota bacterium]